MEISIRGFDASHLLQLSTKWFFRLNGKQQVFQTYLSHKFLVQGKAPKLQKITAVYTTLS